MNSRVLKVVASLGGRGPITVQAFLTEEGPTLSEINPRFGGGFPLTLAAGGAYPEWILQMLDGQDVPARLGEYRRNLYMTRSYTEDLYGGAAVAHCRGIVFDLDDTLYLERDFVRSGFLHVAAMLDGVGGLSREQLFGTLWQWFEEGVRGNSFDRLLAAYPALSERVRTKTLVEAYRSHPPAIGWLDGLPALVSRLRQRGHRLGVISDGPLTCQQAKVSAMGLEAEFAPVVLTDRWGRDFWKPHPRAYEYIASFWELPPRQLLYVGDNPEKDFVTARRLGWHTVRLRMRGQLRCAQEACSPEHAAEAEVSRLDELESLIGKL